MWQTEKQILNGNSAFQPHPFVVGLYGAQGVAVHIEMMSPIKRVWGIYIEVYEVDRQTVTVYQTFCVSCQEIAVCLHMNPSVVDKKLPVSFQKVGRSESFCGLFHLRVAECEPYLRHFVLCKKFMYAFYVGAQKSNVLQSIFQSLLRAVPHSGTFYIHTDKVLLRIFAC